MASVNFIRPKMPQPIPTLNGSQFDGCDCVAPKCKVIQTEVQVRSPYGGFALGMFEVGKWAKILLMHSGLLAIRRSSTLLRRRLLSDWGFLQSSSSSSGGFWQNKKIKKMIRSWKDALKVNEQKVTFYDDVVNQKVFFTLPKEGLFHRDSDCSRTEWLLSLSLSVWTPFCFVLFNKRRQKFCRNVL